MTPSENVQTYWYIQLGTSLPKDITQSTEFNLKMPLKFVSGKMKMNVSLRLLEA